MTIQKTAQILIQKINNRKFYISVLVFLYFYFPIIMFFMSYEVTATRRRPQHFDDLIGQEFVAETLKNSIKSGKTAHAYLFSGPRGCGKTSTARILAKALNCQNGPTDNPCGQCSNCEEITKGTSLDVIEIDGASNTSVENIRQIKDEVLFPPSNSKYKIYIIDEVHMLSTSAFNALLKTIEEPPPYVIFIFATTELQKVPATIKSRCQQFNFRLVAIDKVKKCLEEAANELGIKAEDEALYWIARESTGSMRDAYTLFDQVVAFSDNHITYEKIRDKLGLVGIERLNSIFEACAKNQSDVVLSLLDEFLQCGISIEQLISNCADYLRSLLLIKNNVKKESLLGNSPERYSSLVLGTWNTVQIERALSIFFQLYRDMRYSLSPRYEMELAFSRLCWIGQYVSGAEVKKAIDAASKLIMSGAAIDNSQPLQDNSVQVQKKPDNYIPNGLPRLSMLDENKPGMSEEEKLSSVFDKAPSDITKQTASGVEPDSVIDERLKINIPDENIVNGQIMPTAEVSVKQAEDSHNTPEVPLEGRTFNAEPSMQENGEHKHKPQDTASDDSCNRDSTPEASPAGDDSTNIGNASVNIRQPAMAASDKGSTIEPGQLRDAIIKELTVKDSFTASTLDKTGSWNILPDSVETTVSNAYDLELIKKKIPDVASSISAAIGRDMGFNVILEENREDNEKKEVVLPPQVNMLLDVFKGTLVAGKV